jgi:uncharacterized damage-inducible protein DinB
MPEDKDSLIAHYRQMRDALLAAIDGLSDDLLTEPSLDGWSVKDHLAHLAMWDDIRAGEIARISAGQSPAWPPIDEEQTNDFNAFIHGLREGLSLAQVRWELETSRQRVLDAITAATERGLNGSLYGEAGLRSTHEATHTQWIKRWRDEKGV